MSGFRGAAHRRRRIYSYHGGGSLASGAGGHNGRFRTGGAAWNRRKPEPMRHSLGGSSSCLLTRNHGLVAMAVMIYTRGLRARICCDGSRAPTESSLAVHEL